PSLAPDTRVLVKDRPMTTSTSSIVSIKGDTHWAPPKKRSVSVGVFAAGLGIATAVGAIVAVIAVRALEEPVVHAPTSPRRAVVSTPRPSVAELPAPPPPTEPERVAPVEVAAPPPRSRRTRTKPPPEKKVAAPTPDTIERLDARLTALKGRVQKMRSGAPKAKQAELLQLLRDITVAQSSNELEQKRADLARLTRRAKALQ
ncbi:MAG: hypothetical protein RL846_26025, partial [Deltaproteobacteria bacterium]